MWAELSPASRCSTALLSAHVHTHAHTPAFILLASPQVVGGRDAVCSTLLFWLLLRSQSELSVSWGGKICKDFIKEKHNKALHPFHCVCHISHPSGTTVVSSPTVTSRKPTEPQRGELNNVFPLCGQVVQTDLRVLALTSCYPAAITLLPPATLRESWGSPDKGRGWRWVWNRV